MKISDIIVNSKIAEAAEHDSAADRGSADAWYRRRPRPHRMVSGKYVEITDKSDPDYQAYMKAYTDTKADPMMRDVLDEAEERGLTADQLNIGDEVIITGPVKFNGATGVIADFGRDKRFVVVDLYNHGKKSFHSSDVEENLYAGSEQEADRIGGSDFDDHDDEDIREAKLKEIDYASELGSLQLSDQKIIENSRIVGTIGSRKISLFTSNDDKIYFFANPEKSKIHALVYLSGSRLAGIKNFSENSGLVFNLLQYLINIAGQKLRIDPVDGLTHDGIKWIIKQIKRPNGFQIRDQNGDQVDPKKLYKEWEQARVSNQSGPTGLIIGESKNSQKIKQNEQQLMPLDIWGATLVKLSEERSHVPDLFESQNKLKEARHFRTAYGWAGGSKPSGGRYRHPDQIKADKEARKKEKQALADKEKSKEPKIIETSDPSGLFAASNLDNSFIITAKTAEGTTKKYRVRAQSQATARERFLKHAAQAKILSVKQEK